MVNRLISPSSGAAWLFVAVFAALDAVWASKVGIEIAGAGLLKIMASIGLLLAVAAFYHLSGRSERIAVLAHSNARLASVAAVLTVLSYLAIAARFPLIDGWLSAADKACGLDWLAWFNFVEARAPLRLLLFAVYWSLLPQLLLVMGILALSGRGRRCDELIWLIALALTVTVLIAGFFPALTAPVYYGVTDRMFVPYLPDLLALRNGSFHEIHLDRVSGLIEFPSFHVVLAIFVAYSMRHIKYLFPGAILLAALTIVSAPTVGGHYFVDLMGGAMVAIGAILVIRRIYSPQ